MYRARVMGFNKNNIPNDDPQKMLSIEESS